MAPWDVERLVQILGGDELLTGLSIDLSDGSTVSPERVTDVADLKNDSGRLIEAMTVESTPPPFAFADAPSARVAIVSLRRNRSATVRYHVSGDEREVMRLSRELDEWIGSVTPWYGRIATLDGPRFAFGAALLVAAMALVAGSLFVLLGGVTGSPHAAGFVAATALLALLATGCGVAVMRGFLFPLVLFAVGGGEKRARQLGQRRAVLLWSSGALAAVAVVGSIAGALLG